MFILSDLFIAIKTFMKRLSFLFICSTLAFCNLANAQDASNADKTIATECRQLVFKLGNGMSRMPAIAVKNLSEAKVEMNDFTKTGYTLQQFTVKVLSESTQTFKTVINTGAVFSEETKTLLKTLKPNDFIIVYGIIAGDPLGNRIAIPDRNFAVY